MGEQTVHDTGPLIKRTLVTLSHAIEEVALAGAEDGPLAVVALFQRLPYFDRERDMYSRLATSADAVVVGFVDDFRPRLHGRIHPVLFDADEPLAREWTVVVATPSLGAFLVAQDRETVADGERDLESGRLFDGRWGFGVADAKTELRRLRSALGDRLPPGALATLDRIAAAGDGGPPGRGDRITPAVRLLLDELERTRRSGVVLQERLEGLSANDDRDLTSQLHTASFLRRWAGATRTTTAGPLPLALLLVTIPQLSGVGRYGARAERETVREVASVLTRRLRPIDRVVRLQEEEFLLVIPGADEETAADLIRQVGADLDRLEDVYPFVPMRSISAVTVTRRRPLPLDELRDTVRWAADEGHPVALLPH